MRLAVAAILATAFLGGCATSVVRPVAVSPTTTEREPACTPDASGDWDWALNFRRGNLAERECALRIIATAGAQRSGSTQFNDVRRGVALLHGFYNRRAQRQQALMDMGAGVSLFSAAMGFEGGISNSTRQAWGVAAFAPVLLNQFHGNEPTRELFHGGALALQLVTTRYDRLDRALGGVAAPHTMPDCSGLNRLVEDLDAEMDRNGDLAKEDADGLLLAEARRLQRDCLALTDSHVTMTYAVQQADRIRNLLAADYADAVLQLDHAILAKDRDLRYTAGETLSAVIASPLRAADSLLTGTNAQAAVNSLKTQVAFTGLNRNLGAVRLPPLPSRSAAIAPLPAQVEALDTTGRVARRSLFGPYLLRLRPLAAELRRVQQQQDFAAAMASEYAVAAASDYLTFAYDATTNTTTITLAPRTVAPAPLAIATTATGAAPPITP